MQKKKLKTALVVGAGGIKAAAAIGLFRLLQANGIAIDMVMGCSGGAVVAALIAKYMDGQTVQDTVINLWPSQRTISYRALAQIVAPRLTGGFPHDFALISDKHILNALQNEFGDAQITDLKAPLFLVASDMLDGSKLVLSEGSVVKSVRASIGIPMILGAIELDGRWLLDGGCINPLPIDVAIRENCDLIIAMGFNNPYSIEIDSFQSYVLQTTNIIMNSLLKSQLAFFNAVHHAEIVAMMLDFDEPIDMFETDAVPALVAAGEAEAQKHISYLLKVVERAYSD